MQRLEDDISDNGVETLPSSRQTFLERIKSLFKSDPNGPKLYKRRWLMLLLFSFATMLSSMYFATFSSVR